MKQPDEKQPLMHELSVIFERPGSVRLRTMHVTGTMKLICKHIHLAKIMSMYPVSCYRIDRISDPISGKEYPDLMQPKQVIIEEDKP